MTFQGKTTKYTKIRKLAEGTFGKVYLVEDTFGNKFALKKFKMPDDEVPENYEVETRFGQRIQNEFGEKCATHVVCVHDYGSIPTYFIVYELMDGDLSQYHFKNAEEIVRAYKDCLVGLTQIHKAQLAHNDIKPHNILYKEVNGKIIFKIGDLGALCSSDEIIGFRRPCHAFGTPLFSAPEVNSQFWDRLNYKILQKSDVFALAVSFYYIAYMYLQNYEVLSDHEKMEKLDDERYPYNVNAYLEEVNKIYNKMKARALKQSDFYPAAFVHEGGKRIDKRYFEILDKIINATMVVKIQNRPTSFEALKMIDEILPQRKFRSPQRRSSNKSVRRRSPNKSPQRRSPNKSISVRRKNSLSPLYRFGTFTT